MNKNKSWSQLRCIYQSDGSAIPCSWLVARKLEQPLFTSYLHPRKRKGSGGSAAENFSSTRLHRTYISNPTSFLGPHRLYSCRTRVVSLTRPLPRVEQVVLRAYSVQFRAQSNLYPVKTPGSLVDASLHLALPPREKRCPRFLFFPS